MIFKTTGRTPPFEELTDGFGKLGHTERRKITNELSDEAQLSLSNRTTTEGDSR